MFQYAGLGQLQTIYDAKQAVAKERQKFNTTLLVGGVVLLGSAGYYVYRHR